MVVLAASICSRGGKAIVSRQFREMPRSRVEALLAGFPKLAVAGSQHTTAETENVRFVYQPLDEMYMVLITNKASNILQDIDSLHLFVQVVSSICKSLDEREILKNSFELLSAFDEVVALGYRENLTLQQIRTFLEMESHEERIQEIIARNKEFEASEERKRKAKQLEMQRKEMSRNQSGMGGGMGSQRAMGSSTPKFPTYTPPAAKTDTYDSYAAEKARSSLPASGKGKGMRLGHKSKTTDMFERVRSELGGSAEEERAPLVSSTPTPAAEAPPFQTDGTGIAVTIAEQLSAELQRDGNLKSFDVKGSLMLRIADPALTKLKIDVSADTSTGANFKTHPNVDRAAFTGSGVLQLKDTNRDFPLNNQTQLLRWQYSSTSAAPISFTIWVNAASAGKYAVTVEYELADEADTLKDVIVSIPFATSEPKVSSMDEVYEVSGDTLEWNIPSIGEDNAQGAFEFEAEADDESDFFPMRVTFRRENPIVGVDVTAVKVVGGDEVEFRKEVRSVAENYLIV